MRTVVLDGEKIQNREMLHDVLAEGLNFPEWYGRNLDALFDCLTDLRSGAKIVLCREELLREKLGAYADVLVKVFCEAMEENASLQIERVKDFPDLEK